jgi:hypothetical protein
VKQEGVFQKSEECSGEKDYKKDCSLRDSNWCSSQIRVMPLKCLDLGYLRGINPKFGKNVDSILGRRNIFGDKIYDAVSFEPEPTKNFKSALPTKLNALADPCR